MKQRYHYNVANTRVDQHVEKGNDDGLYISSVACCHELWALIMDAGTGFSAQVGARSCLSGNLGLLFVYHDIVAAYPALAVSLVQGRVLALQCRCGTP